MNYTLVSGARSARVLAITLVSLPTIWTVSASAQVPLYNLNGSFEFGNDLDHVGDVDGDGRSDFAIGIPRDNTVGLNAGKLEVRSGKTGLVLFSIMSLGNDDQFGNRVLAAGDVNGDGTPDILGSSLESQGNALSGYVGLFSGVNGSVIRMIHPNVGDAGFGRAVASGCDIDGDGVPEVAVGAYSNNATYVYSPATGEMLAKFHPTDGADGFGMSLDFVSDVDNDDSPDLLIGAPFGNYAEIRSIAGGQVRRLFVGAEPGARFGQFVRCLGDTDLDGTQDVGIGAPLANSNGPSSGYAAVFSAMTGAQLLRIDGLGGYEHGSRIAPAGDVNQDGRADFLVGSPYSDIAMLHSGATGKTLAAYPGDGLSYGYGNVLAGGGDTDGDGIPNVLIGSSGHPLSLPLVLQVKLMKECAGTYEWIGSGCAAPGATSVVPRLDVSGCAKPQGWLAIRVSGTNKPTPAIVLLGSTLTNVKLPGGCPVLVTGLMPVVVKMTLEPQTLGSAEKTMFLPLSMGTPKGTVFMQAILPEGAYAATTNVVKVTVE